MDNWTTEICVRLLCTGERKNAERQIKNLSDYALYRQMDVQKMFEEHISGTKKNEVRTVVCEAISYCKVYRMKNNHRTTAYVDVTGISPLKVYR